MKEQKKDCVVLITKGCKVVGQHHFSDGEVLEERTIPLGICEHGNDTLLSAKEADTLAKRLGKKYPHLEYTVYAPVPPEPTWHVTDVYVANPVEPPDAADAKWSKPTGIGDKPLLQSSHPGIICAVKEPAMEEKLVMVNQELDLLNYHVAHFRITYGYVDDLRKLYTMMGQLGGLVQEAKTQATAVTRRFEQIKSDTIAKVES